MLQVTTHLTCHAWVASDVYLHLILGSLGLHESVPQSVYWFSGFCTAHPCAQARSTQTDTQTMQRATYVANGHTYGLLVGNALWEMQPQSHVGIGLTFVNIQDYAYFK